MKLNLSLQHEVLKPWLHMRHFTCNTKLLSDVSGIVKPTDIGDNWPCMQLPLTFVTVQL